MRLFCRIIISFKSLCLALNLYVYHNLSFIKEENLVFYHDFVNIHVIYFLWGNVTKLVFSFFTEAFSTT